MTGVAEQLSALREQVAIDFDAAGQRVLAAVLAQLEAQARLEPSERDDTGPMLDQLEDLVEALLREAGWIETKGRRA